MSDPVLLSRAQMRRIEPFFPRSRGLARVDDRRVISGIIYVIRHGLQWKDAPPGYGPPKTLYNRFIRWSRLGVFARISQPSRPRAVFGAADDRCHPSEGASHCRQPAAKGALPRCLGRTKGDLNSKLHAVCDGQGRPFLLLLTEGQMSDHRGAAMMLSALPPARELLADRSYDSSRFRAELTTRGITPCIPSTKSRKIPLPYDKLLYRQRHRIENMFGRLKGWRRVATRYDRCAHTFFSAIRIAAAVTFWLS
jgi:transposase